MAKTKKAKKTSDDDDDTKSKKSDGPRPRQDAYVMMLFITFVAIVAGTVLLYLDFEEYGSKQPPKETVPALPKLGDSLPKPADPTPPKGPDPDPMGGDPMGMPMGGMPMGMPMGGMPMGMMP